MYMYGFIPTAEWAFGLCEPEVDCRLGGSIAKASDGKKRNEVSKFFRKQRNAKVNDSRTEKSKRELTAWSDDLGEPTEHDRTCSCRKEICAHCPAVAALGNTELTSDLNR